MKTRKHAHDYDPKCQDCQPAFLDSATGRVLPDDSPDMRLAMAVWWKQPEEVRRGFLHVTRDNSRDPADVHHMQVYVEALEAAQRN